jgi:ParB family chromosome partitioning protein
VGKSRVTVTNLLRLNELHPEVKELLVTGRLEMGHARALLGLPLEQQAEAGRLVVDRQLTVRATEVLVQNLKKGKPVKPVPALTKDPDIRSLENDLAGRIGAEVNIKHGKKGSGQLIIRYDSLDQLEGVLERIR